MPLMIIVTFAMKIGIRITHRIFAKELNHGFGEPIEIDGLALKDNRTGAIIPAYSYTVAYKNNTDDGTGFAAGFLIPLCFGCVFMCFHKHTPYRLVFLLTSIARKMEIST